MNCIILIIWNINRKCASFKANANFKNYLFNLYHAPMHPLQIHRLLNFIFECFRQFFISSVMRNKLARLLNFGYMPKLVNCALPNDR